MSPAVKDWVRQENNAWFIIAACVGALTLINVVSRVMAWSSVRRWRHAQQQVGDEKVVVAVSDDEKQEERTTASAVAVVETLPGATTRATARRQPLGALFTVYQSFAHLNTIRRPSGWPWRWVAEVYDVSPCELMVTLAYTGVVLGLGFHGSHGKPKPFANQIGHIAYSQLPLVIALAQKNSIVSFLTGISYERLNVYHRLAGRVFLLCSWIHTAGRLYLGLTDDKKISEAYVQWGIAGLAMFTLATVLAFRSIRARMYEAFLLSHLLLIAGSLLSLYYHRTEFNQWIKAGVALWAMDRGVRIVRSVVINKAWAAVKSKATRIEVMPGGEVMRVTLDREWFTWSPGQHAFLMMPTLGGGGFRLEAHPFTMVTTPDRATHQVTFLLKARDGFTKRLLQHALASDESTTSLVTCIDGPYGAPRSLAHHDSILLIAGGTGITFAFSHLCGVMDDMMATTTSRRSRTRVVKLVWMIRDAQAFEWIRPLLERRLAALPATRGHGLDVSIEIYVTSTTTDTPTLSPFSPALAATAPPQVVGSSAMDDIYTVMNQGAQQERRESDQTVVSSGSVVGDDEKNDAPTGTSLSSIVSWHRGRADLLAIIDEMSECHSGNEEHGRGRLSVNVCGPATLQRASRKAVDRVAKAGEVLAGKRRVVEYYAETFGW